MVMGGVDHNLGEPFWIAGHGRVVRLCGVYRTFRALKWVARLCRRNVFLDRLFTLFCKRRNHIRRAEAAVATGVCAFAHRTEPDSRKVMTIELTGAGSSGTTAVVLQHARGGGRRSCQRET